MTRGTFHVGARYRPLLHTLLCAGAALLLAHGTAQAADPDKGDARARAPLCCGVPPADEVTADQVFGHWVVRRAGIGMPLRRGEHVEFRSNGTIDTRRGPCRFAILRAELTIECAGTSQSGELRFIDDTKLLWRQNGREALFIAPAD